MGSEDDQEPQAQVAAQIDENLKRVYAEVSEGDVPDRFRDLLARLKAQDTEQGAEG